jgi:hypothetical protein
MVERHTTSQGLCETTLTERFEFSECVCGTYPDNLGPCRTFGVGVNPKRCVFCDHKIQCHAAVDERFDREEEELARQRANSRRVMESEEAARDEWFRTGGLHQRARKG